MKKIVILVVTLIILIGSVSAQASRWNSLTRVEKGYVLVFSSVGVDSAISVLDYALTTPAYKSNSQKLAAASELKQSILEISSFLVQKIRDYGIENTIDIVDSFYKKPENASYAIGVALFKILNEFH